MLISWFPLEIYLYLDKTIIWFHMHSWFKKGWICVSRQICIRLCTGDKSDKKVDFVHHHYHQNFFTFFSSSPHLVPPLPTASIGSTPLPLSSLSPFPLISSPVKVLLHRDTYICPREIHMGWRRKRDQHAGHSHYIRYPVLHVMQMNENHLYHQPFCSFFFSLVSSYSSVGRGICGKARDNLFPE